VVLEPGPRLLAAVAMVHGLAEHAENFPDTPVSMDQNVAVAFFNPGLLSSRLSHTADISRCSNGLNGLRNPSCSRDSCNTTWQASHRGGIEVQHLMGRSAANGNGKSVA
jgi:hypothetical protein